MNCINLLNMNNIRFEMVYLNIWLNSKGIKILFIGKILNIIINNIRFYNYLIEIFWI